ncbi:MAG: tetratricopeptide repeat protein [Syntrophobacteraceae bacterium]
MTRFKFLLFVALVIGFAALAYAGYDEAVSANKEGDYAKAYEECKKVAEQGDPRGQADLARMYQCGHGVPKDYAEAAKWYRKAAEQGDMLGEWSLGEMYSVGEGVPQDYSEAFTWFRRAAEQGYLIAQCDLGRIYRDGVGVPQDLVQAHMWYNLAGAQGFSEAQKMRDILAKKMTPSQIAEAQRLAREWKPKGRD